MKFHPNTFKFKKEFKGKVKTKSKAGLSIEHGTYGLVSSSHTRINGSQIESARIAIMKVTKKLGNVWIRIFPTTPITRKPIEVRMGRGKGEVYDWVFRIGIGRVLFELQGVEENTAKKAFQSATHKLNISSTFVNKITSLTY